MTTDPMPAGDRAARLGTVRRRRGRRAHAAPGGRILAGSVSVAVALGLMGAMADAADTVASPTVVFVRRPAGATVALPGAPRVLPTAAAPVASSQGS